MLDLSPEIENAVRDTAAREGVSINEVVARKFTLALSTKAAAPFEDPIWALLREQVAEAANATPEEIAPMRRATVSGSRTWTRRAAPTANACYFLTCRPCHDYRH